MNISLHIEAASAQELHATLAALLPPAPSAAVQNPSPAAATPAEGAGYDLAQLANASRALVSAGRQQALTALLGEFGVARLADVPPERYGEYALGLRALGVDLPS